MAAGDNIGLMGLSLEDGATLVIPSGERVAAKVLYVEGQPVKRGLYSANSANGIAAASHAGVKTMLGLHFVSKGLIDREHGKTFSRLFEIRHTGDYDDFVYCDKEMIDEYTPKAEAFIGSIKELLTDNK